MQYVCRIGPCKIFKYKGSFLVHNVKKKFKQGHTHVDTFKQAKLVATLVNKSVVPDHISNYLYDSLIRLSLGEYRRKLLRNRR